MTDPLSIFHNAANVPLVIHEPDPSFHHLHRVDCLGITILEPSTVISSLAMTAVCLVALVRLSRVYTDHPVHRFTRYFLIFMALATAIGGILGHGILYLTGVAGKLPGWISSLLAIAFYERAVIWYVRPLVSGKLFNRLLVYNIVSLLCFVLATILVRHFMVVQIQAFSSLCVVVGVLGGISYSRVKDRGSVCIFVALALAFAAALIHAAKLHVGDWLNTNDISHIPMAASIWYFYKAMTAVTPAPAVAGVK